jgi:hypothetical protein
MIIALAALTAYAQKPEYFDCIMDEYEWEYEGDSTYAVTYLKGVYIDGVLRGSLHGLKITTQEPTYARKIEDYVLPGVYYKSVRIKPAVRKVLMKQAWQETDEGYSVYWHYDNFEIPLTRKELQAVKVKSIKSKRWTNGETKECIKVFCE